MIRCEWCHVGADILINAFMIRCQLWSGDNVHKWLEYGGCSAVIWSVKRIFALAALGDGDSLYQTKCKLVTR